MFAFRCLVVGENHFLYSFAGGKQGSEFLEADECLGVFLEDGHRTSEDEIESVINAAPLHALEIDIARDDHEKGFVARRIAADGAQAFHEILLADEAVA